MAIDRIVTKVHEATDDILDITKKRHDLTDRNWRSSSLVRLGPCDDKLLFLGTQPARVGWKVGDQEVCTNADDDCRYPFKYEYPSPTTVAADTVHVGDSTGK